MKRQSVNPSVLKMPECPVVFYLPFSRLPISSYAEMTNQTVRAVQQQANKGKIALTSAQPGKERQSTWCISSLRIFMMLRKTTAA